jgi:Ca2+-transporting ATPase
LFASGLQAGAGLIEIPHRFVQSSERRVQVSAGLLKRRMATMLGDIQAAKTPLERRVDQLGRQIARWVLVLAVALGVVGVVAEGISRAPGIIIFAVALAVAAVPEGLPAVLTVALALGVERMARHRAVVRRLSAVEALGSVTVIATDKTGTLTEPHGRPQARRVRSAARARGHCARERCGPDDQCG